MMRAGLLAAAALLAAPLSAQDGFAAESLGTTAEQDLECVLWASYTLGTAGADAQPQLVNSLTLAVAWFTGLYEGKTGQAINEPLRARSATVTQEEIGALGAPCIARLDKFGKRLSSFAD
ncbi:MAG: hypothetical protein V2J14_02725 [Erythrobacter sp.]|jgi:hypothetical protein|nr:hypothetical protein [Erythrobacter sp.]